MRFALWAGAFILALSPAADAQTYARLISVDEARFLALQRNKDIKISRHSVSAALGRAEAEKGGFDPVLEVDGSYDRGSVQSESALEDGGVKTRVMSASAGVRGKLPTGAYYDIFRFAVSKDEVGSPLRSLKPSYPSSLGFKIGQNLLRDFGGGAERRAVIKAALRSDISKLSLRVRTEDALLDVERAYWNLVAARLHGELRKQNLDLGVDLLERNRVKVREGVLPRLEEMKAESAVAARRVELIEAENEINRAEDRLRNLIGLPQDTPILLTDLPYAESGARHNHTAARELINAAFENRAEIKQAVKRVKIAEREKNFRRNQRLPTLAVEGSLSLSGLAGRENAERLAFGDETIPVPDSLLGGAGDSLSRLRNGDFVSWGASVRMSVPIGNRRASGLYREAAAELNIAIVEYRKIREDIALEVKEASDALWSAYKRVEAADAALTVAGEVLEAEKEKYAAGLSTTREVLEAQTELARARSESVRSAADHKNALAALRRAKGTIIEESGVKTEGF